MKLKNTFKNKEIILSQYFLLSISVILLISGCGKPVFDGMTRKDEEPVKFEKKQFNIKEVIDNLDYKFFYQTALKLEIPDNVKNNISADDYLVICSGDRVLNDYKSLQFIVEQAIIKKCLTAKYRILTRDSIPLLRIYSEKNLNFKGIFSTTDSLFNPYEIKPPFTNNIYPASKIISYHILDAGIKKINSGEGEITRLGNIYLRIDLIDVKTSQILASELTEIFNQDIISDKLNNLLQTYNLENVRYPFPILTGIDRKTDKFNLPVEFVKTGGTGGKKMLEFTFTLGTRKAIARITDQKGSQIYQFPIPNYSNSPSYYGTFKQLWDISTVPAGNYTFIVTSAYDSSNIFYRKEFIIQ